MPGSDEGERVLSLRDAAELCQTTYTALRKRADRGSLRTVMQGGRRMVPLSELEREGLLPDAAERELRARVAELEAELASTRQLTERAHSELEAERQARELVEVAMHEQRAAAATAAAALAEREAELEAVVGASRGALGIVRAWRAARALRRAGHEDAPPGQ